jgi:putative solute:sodium symporter small subunit
MPDSGANGALRQQQRRYWFKTLGLTAVLLSVWFLVTFVVPFFSEPLNRFTMFGLPLGYLMGAQGSLIVYLVLIGVYAHLMNRLDRQFGVDEQ